MSMDLTTSSLEEEVVVSCINMSMDLNNSSWEEEVVGCLLYKYVYGLD